MSKKNKNIANKLIHHYRWLIIDEDNKESIISFKLNFLNFLLILSLFLIFTFIFSIFLLRYSPLKEYFRADDDYSGSISNKKELLLLNERIMNLEDSLQTNKLYINAINNVLHGRVEAVKVDSLLAKKSPVLVNDKSLEATEEDSLFRMQIAQEELEEKKLKPKVSHQLLFPPVRGVITSSYDITTEHLATDIAASKGDDVKAITDGKVILVDWSPETGNTIMIQHKNNMVSIYKHCEQVYKKIGDEVGKGDVIASVGNSGELSTGPHLHFELWIKGNAVNAEEYIEF